jgi:hypothetical protein
MVPAVIIAHVKQDYTAGNLISYLIQKVNSQYSNEKELLRAPFWDKLHRRIQFQLIRGQISKDNNLDRSFLRDEDYILDYCTAEEFNKALAEHKGQEEDLNVTWPELKNQASKKATDILYDQFFDIENSQLTHQGAQVLLYSLGYIKEDLDKYEIDVD